MTGISNGRLGMMLLVGTETVLFSTFIGAYIVLRFAAASWPPLGTPTLGLGLSSMNTAVLILSSCVIAFARHSGESRNPVQGFWTPASAGVTGCFILGVLFLILQGVEFHRLYARGLTLQTGSYGALFYTLISCHGLHVLGGLGILAVALWKGRGASPVLLSKFSKVGAGPTIELHRGRASRRPLHSDWAGYAEMYWHFVTGVWLVLFAVIYIV